MMRFIGRKEELSFLENYYARPTFRALALIGRRRIGKTTLIKKFLEGKKHIYIQFLKSSSDLNLLALERTLSEYLGKSCSFGNYLDFFEELKMMARNERTVFAFDEYPYICEAESSFSSLLQHFIDHDIEDSLVLLSGSSISMMNEEIEDRSRPLFGRVHPYHLDEMDIGECRDFYPEMGDEDYLRTYLTFGGIPLYYTIPGFDTYQQLIEETVLKDNSVFHDEGENIVNRELGPALNYHKILDALANGSDEISSISVITGLDRQLCASCLSNLMELKLVSQVHPMVGMKSKPASYYISDRILSFHYYVQRRNPASADTYESVKNHIYTHHGRIFEDQCARYLCSHYKIREIGKWVGAVVKCDPEGNAMKDELGRKIHETADIDIVATVFEGDHPYELFCECKFTGNTVGFQEYNKLMERVRATKSGPDRRLAFFSRYGYDERFEEFAKSNRIMLFGLKDLLG